MQLDVSTCNRPALQPLVRQRAVEATRTRMTNTTQGRWRGRKLLAGVESRAAALASTLLCVGLLVKALVSSLAFKGKISERHVLVCLHTDAALKLRALVIKLHFRFVLNDHRRGKLFWVATKSALGLALYFRPPHNYSVFCVTPNVKRACFSVIAVFCFVFRCEFLFLTFLQTQQLVPFRETIAIGSNEKKWLEVVRLSFCPCWCSDFPPPLNITV